MNSTKSIAAAAEAYRKYRDARAMVLDVDQSTRGTKGPLSRGRIEKLDAAIMAEVEAQDAETFTEWKKEYGFDEFAGESRKVLGIAGRVL